MEEWIKNNFKENDGLVQITFVNGKELVGEIVSIRDNVLIVFSEGETKPIAYSLIGTCEKIVPNRDSIGTETKVNEAESSDFDGYIVKYTPKQYGFITEKSAYDGSNKGMYIFRAVDIDSTFKEKLDTFKYHYYVKYDVVENKGKKVAKNVKIVGKKSLKNNVEILKPTKKKGYIMKCLPSRSIGYIIESSSYDGKTEGHIIFNYNDFDGDAIQLNTFANHYYVDYDEVSENGRIYAKNVQVNEVVPIVLHPENQWIPMSLEDLNAFNFEVGETLVVSCKSSSDYIIGEFTEKTDTHLIIMGADQVERIKIEEINDVFFVGLITNYNHLSGTGVIDDKYSFRQTTIINKHLKHLLGLGKSKHFLCLYSLMVDGRQLYIKSIDFFDKKKVLDFLPWKKGKIIGVYEKNDFFSIDKISRCYIGQVSDNELLRFIADEDFLLQSVFYKTVMHKSIGERRQEGIVSSVVEVVSEYQEGKIFNPSGNTMVQCGSQIFSLSNDYSEGIDLGASVVGLVKFHEGELCIKPDAELKRPSYKDDILKKKSQFDAKVKQAEIDGDFKLQIELNTDMLEKQMISPETAIGVIFKICVSEDKYEDIIEVLKKYGYLLKKRNYYCFMFQTLYLVGDVEKAKDNAKLFLKFTPRDPFYQWFAEQIEQGICSRDKLRDDILQAKESAEPFRIGEIAYYHQPTKTGYILGAEGRKLNFSYKDIIEWDGKTIDVQNNKYTVRYKIAETSGLLRATEVEIMDVMIRTEEAGAVQIKDETYFAIENAESGDFIGANSIFAFKCETLNLTDIINWLPEYRRLFKDGKFVGNEDDAKKLAAILSDGAQKRSQQLQDYPDYKRFDLFLAAANIKNLQYNLTGEANLYEEINGLLWNYAWRLVRTAISDNDAEIAYYCESIALNTPAERYKYIMVARNVYKLFEPSIDYKDIYNVVGIRKLLRKRCKNIDLFRRIVFNMPSALFDVVLAASNQELLSCIIESLANNEEVIVSPEEYGDYVYHIFKTYQTNVKQFAEDMFQHESAFANAQHLLLLLERFVGDYRQYIFESDKKTISRIASEVLKALLKAQKTEEPGERVDQIKDIIPHIKHIVLLIEKNPSKLLFETIRPTLNRLKQELVEYLKKQYNEYSPRLSAHHLTLKEAGRRELIEICLNDNCIPAENVNVISVDPLESYEGFSVDVKTRGIEGNGDTITCDHSAEISVPIVIINEKVGDIVELQICYEFSHSILYNLDSDIVEKKVERGYAFVQVPTKMSGIEAIYVNPYSELAGGREMYPEKSNDSAMFFGREKDIDDIYEMIFDKGKLIPGAIVALYGQRRCGKSSTVHFLAERIKNSIQDAIILNINIQGITATKELYYHTILSRICSQLRTWAIKHKEFGEELAQNGLNIPSIKDTYFEALFSEFFLSFRAVFGERYPIVLMVDEFTQVYIHMKNHSISEDFLNLWRAMVQEHQFTNILIGQDFMDKFVADSEVASQNMGAAVNGLGTAGRKRLTYLDRISSFRMMDEPILLPSGASRYQKSLGLEAKELIYELTGGSAFYLMKFCNGLVDYMMNAGERLITPSLVNTVAKSFVFDMSNNPINKKDFDPIYNEFSAKEDDDDANDIVKETTAETYRLLKQIAERSDSGEICNMQDIEEYDRSILKSLFVRGVLVDQNGKDIVRDDFDSLFVKIKVRLFAIWLRERG